MSAGEGAATSAAARPSAQTVLRLVSFRAGRLGNSERARHLGAVASTKVTAQGC